MNIRLKGFTLVEIIVVMAIIVFLTASTIAGVFYIQDASLLDNAVREIRSFLLSTQTIAQSKFVVSEGDIFSSGNGIVVATYFQISSVATGSSGIKLTRGIVYFTPSQNTFAPEKVTQEISELFSTRSNNYACNGQNFYADNSVYQVNPTTNGNVKYDLFCTNNFNLDIYLEKNINGVRKENSSSCGDYVFFSSGYSKILANNINANGSCDIKIRTSSFFGVTNTINISKDGYIKICGSNC